jgi:hypothetical protein
MKMNAPALSASSRHANMPSGARLGGNIRLATRSRQSTEENVAMAKKEAKKLDELFHDTLKDIYFAEKKDPQHASQDGKSGSGLSP